MSGTWKYGPYIIKPIADDCTDARVFLNQGPAPWRWNFAKGALLAHPQFKVVAGPPAGPGEVELEAYDYYSGYALVARCSDGMTCNKLAAMYKAVVRSSNPKPYCGGPMKGITGPPLAPPNYVKWPDLELPDGSDYIANCPRLAACMIAADPSIPGDPGLSCQASPNRFKHACATKASCAAVLQCAK